MKWTRIRIKTITEAEDIIISDLNDIGLEGALIEDKVPLSPLEKEQMFVDICPDPGQDDGVAYLSFFVEEGTKNISELLESIREVLQDISTYMPIGEGTIAVDETEDLDWINNWKKYFHSFYIDDLLVIPSWEEVKPQDKDKMILHIDPGTAFGTGMHETTKLCIQALRKIVSPETNILDIGTGSGILGILGLMFGAKRVTATDLDRCAIEAVRQNLEDNNINPELFQLIIGNIIDNEDVKRQITGDVSEGYECVCANILAPVLVELTPVVAPLLKKGGYYITSGIIQGKEDTVKKAMTAAGLTVIETNYLGEWVGVVAKK